MDTVRLLRDRSEMAMEDQLSQVSEQDYRDLLEKQLWKQREAERRAQWEKQQQLQDEIEEQQRKERLAELEAKKAKLIALKQQQANSSTTNSNCNSISAAKAKEDADKLARQLRIQNKAKFISKRIQSGEKAEEIVRTFPSSKNSSMRHDRTSTTNSHHSSMNNNNNSSCRTNSHSYSYADGNYNPNGVLFDMENITEVEETDTADDDGVGDSANRNSLGINNSEAIATLAAQRAEKEAQKREEQAAQAEYQLLIDSISDDSELKKLLADLMTEKRSLRLEQRQVLSHGLGGNSGEKKSTDELVSAIRKKIVMATFKEEIVQKRLDGIHTNNDSMNPRRRKSIDQNKVDDLETQVIRTNDSNGTAISTTVLKTFANAVVSSVGRTTSAYSTGGEKVSHSSENNQIVYRNAENLLQEANNLVHFLEVVTSRDSKGVAFTEDDPIKLRRATILSMELVKIAHEIDKENDHVNYIDKLTAASQKLTIAHESASKVITAAAINSKREIIGRRKSCERPMSAKKTPVAAIDRILNGDETNKTLSGSDGTKKSSGNCSKPIEKVQTDFGTANDRTGSPGHTIAEDNPLGQKVKKFMLMQREKTIKKHEKQSNEQASSIASTTATTPTQTPTPDQEKLDIKFEEPIGQPHPKENEKEKNTGDSDVDFSSINLPGWQECMHTSMATAAHHAAFYGYLEVLQFLSEYFDCFVMDAKGRTPLFYAALQNRLDCAAFLVSIDSRWLDVGDEKGDTALHAAAISNSINVLHFLLSCEANPDTANMMGLTASHLAKTKDALIILHESGSQPYCVDLKSRLPLWFACHDGRKDCVEFLCSVTPTHYLLWPDDEGESCLHVAAAHGHHYCVEALCQFLPNVEDLYVVNRKNYTAAHVAANSAVLRVLYEQGANLWLTDTKGRMPLFISSFYGRVDCVSFLIDLINKELTICSKKEPKMLLAKDNQGGDTALHAACLCGHLQCAVLLSYYIPSVSNTKNLTPEQLARSAGHQRLADLILWIEAQRKNGVSTEDAFGCSFSALADVILYYGSRWSKYYDHNYDSNYYYDRITGTTQWERPEAYDEPEIIETRIDRARELLKQFYSQYNTEKLKDINDIIVAYYNNYTKLFISLANKYEVQDLSLFAGIHLDD